MRREKAQALTCFLYLSLEALNFPLVTPAQGSGHCRPYAILPHLTACRGRRHLSVLRGWRELPWLRAPLSLQGDNTGWGGRQDESIENRAGGGKRGSPEPPLPSPAAETRAGTGVFWGEAAAPSVPREVAVLAGSQCPSTHVPVALSCPCQLVLVWALCPRPRGRSSAPVTLG